MKAISKKYGIIVGSCRLLIGVLAALLGLDSAQALAGLPGFYRGNAFGTYTFTNVGPVTGSQGHTALLVAPCNGTGGEVLSNELEELNVPDILTVGVASTNIVTNETSSSKTIQSVTTIDEIRLLNGLITLDNVKAVATTEATHSEITSTALGSYFSNLRIAGFPNVFLNVAPNTKINLPGVGYVILREVVYYGNNTVWSAVHVNMLRVVVTNSSNPFSLPVGLNIVVGHSQNGFVRGLPEVVLAGHAFAARSVTNIAGIQSQIGKLGANWVGCEGTGGITKANTINSVDVIGVFSLGSGETTAYGSRTATTATARTTATLQNVSLLGGLITLDAVTAVAESNFTSGQGQSNTEGSQFVNLKVAGVNGGLPLSNIAPNTKLNVPGIGTIILYERYVRNLVEFTRAEVLMIHITVGADNILGLSAGDEIKIGWTSSVVTPF